MNYVSERETSVYEQEKHERERLENEDYAEDYKETDDSNMPSVSF